VSVGAAVLGGSPSGSVLVFGSDSINIWPLLRALQKTRPVGAGTGLAHLLA
jgi:hypothetical protein